ncbi:YdcF family protein [Pantanalinema rosaneae CENA516]|uniref:YdcF family protein n=1 Tax=Pantanalinema rosaneae TaxID=1620701 RepID=UPI003D6FBE70
MAFLQRSAHLFPASRAFQMTQKSYLLLSGLILTVAISYIPIRLAIARWQAPQPQAILTLGGRPAREVFTADFARLHPELPIWISSGLLPKDARPLFRQQGIADERVTLDYRAIDTVTNFTTLVKDLEHQHIRHVYLITSDYHMARSQAIATIVLGSHGITFTAIAIPSTRLPEDRFRTVRDVTRSLIWLATGYTGAEIKRSECRSDRAIE